LQQITPVRFRTRENATATSIPRIVPSKTRKERASTGSAGAHLPGAPCGDLPPGSAAGPHGLWCSAMVMVMVMVAVYWARTPVTVRSWAVITSDGAS